MRQWHIIAWVAGICLVPILPAPIGPWWGWFATALLPAGLGLWHYHQHRNWPLFYALPIVFLLAFAWSLSSYTRALDMRISEAEARNTQLSGQIIALPEPREKGIRLMVEGHWPRRHGTGNTRLLLTDYRPELPHYRPGQTYQFEVTLKPPHGQINPGGFDQENWLLQNHLAGTGTIRNSILQDDTPWASPVHTLRQMIAKRMDNRLANIPGGGLVKALVVGDTASLNDQDWQRYRLTGVIHLVSISGLHVTLFAGIAGFLISSMWRRLPRACLWMPARKAGLAAGLLAALGYSLLAGFAIPTQRTFFMLLVAAACYWQGRRPAISTVWGLALAGVLTLDPMAALSPGFWLSFLLVGVLLWAGGNRVGKAGRVREFTVAQWAATLASIPLLGFWFGQMPLLSPLANAPAIPLVGTLITPLSLLGLVDPTGFCWQLAAWLCQWLNRYLDWLLTWQWPQWYTNQTGLAGLLFASAGSLLLLLPRGARLWLPGLVLLIPALLPRQTDQLQAGEYDVWLLDAGQGLSAVIHTRQHTLLFDSGPPGAENQIVPALQTAGWRQIDKLVLSHDDNDHTGGFAGLLEAQAHGLIKLSEVVSSLEPQSALRQSKLPAPHRPCLAGESWTWDGVTFRWLWPEKGLQAGSDNARSCVLRVESDHGRILILADLEQTEEARLLAQGQDLTSEAVVVGHHGSKTSSSPALIEAVATPLALIASGYRNRFHHPAPAVVDRWKSAGATVANTADQGAIQLEFRQDGWQWRGLRQTQPRLWRTPASANGVSDEQ